MPCSAIFDTMDLYTDPHLIARGFVHTIEHDEIGRIPLLGWPVRMSASSVPIEAAPFLGRHTEEVLRSDLNLGAAEIEALANAGAIGLTRKTRDLVKSVD